MDITTAALFVPGCFALNMAPGPNNLLSVTNAVRYGFRQSLLAGVGRLLAFVGMLALAAAGLAIVLQTSELLFHGIRIAGAAYLLYLAVQLWRADATPEAAPAGAAGDLLGLARQEFLVALGNPKAIVIFTAFLPQFVDPAQPTAPQFALVSALFLVLEGVAIAAYALIGLHLRRWFMEPCRRRIFNRGCSTLLLGASLGMLASRRA